MTKNGISDENLNKLFTHAQINLRDQDMVRNLSYVGINVLTDVSDWCGREPFSFECVRILNFFHHWKSYVHRAIAKRHTRCHERIVLPNKHIRCRDGLRVSLNLLKPRDGKSFVFCVFFLISCYCCARIYPVLKDILEDCIDDRLDSRHFPFLAGRAQNSTYHAPTRYKKYQHFRRFFFR